MKTILLQSPIGNITSWKNAKKDNFLLKMQAAFLLLIIMGTVFVAVNSAAAVMPKQKRSDESKSIVITDQKRTEPNSYELDYTSITEIDAFMRSAAKNNDYKFTRIYYSAALLYETKDALIVIGHGHFDSKGQYSIGDYNENEIHYLAKEKTIAILLACYSDIVILTNAKQLSFTNEIDVLTAMNELVTFLNWEVKNTFLPTNNIALHELDPGEGGSYDPADVPVLFETKKEAYSGWDGSYWDLSYETSIYLLSNWLLTHDCKVVLFTFEGEFLVELAPYYYVTEDYEITFKAWFKKELDLNDYLHMKDIYIDGVQQNNPTGTITADEIIGDIANALGCNNNEANKELAKIFFGVAAGFATISTPLLLGLVFSTPTEGMAMVACVAFGLFYELYVIFLILALVMTAVWFILEHTSS
jgi:hypothetical protein